MIAVNKNQEVSNANPINSVLAEPPVAPVPSVLLSHPARRTNKGAASATAPRTQQDVVMISLLGEAIRRAHCLFREGCRVARQPSFQVPLSSSRCV